MLGDTKVAVEHPLPLPAEYARALTVARERVEEVRAAIKGAGLDAEQTAELQAAINGHFKEWLHTTGALRQVVDIVKVFKEHAKDVTATSPATSSDAST
jgi:hypothetical protein